MANNVEPEVLINSVLGKISDVLINGDGDILKPSDDHFLAFMSPGIPMSDEDFLYATEGFGGIERKNVNPENISGSIGPQEGAVPIDAATDAAKKYINAEAFHSMCDLIPDTSNIIESNKINTWNPEARVSSVYSLALQMSQVANIEVDDETKAEIDRLRKMLQSNMIDPDTGEELDFVVPSNKKIAYDKHMLKFLEESIEFNNVRISAIAQKDQEAIHQFLINGNVLKLKVEAARNAWSTLGFKGLLDKAAADIASTEDRSFTLLKEKYKQDFRNSILSSANSGANFLYTAPAPASFIKSDSGWTEFKFNKSSFESNHSFTSSNTKGMAGFSIGIVNFGGSGGVENKRITMKTDTESFSMRFKMCRVPIYRPWMHLDYIKSGFWRFDENNPVHINSIISDGQMPPHGLMPAISQECVFIRDLFLDFGESTNEKIMNARILDGSAGMSIGPFWGGGRHTNNSSNTEHTAEYSSQGIRIPGLQLLGFICHALPKAPQPNPDIQDWI